MLKDDLQDNRFDNLITETIKHLSDGYINDAGEGLVEIARYFARAGLSKESFLNMREYIVKMSAKTTGDIEFILAKLRETEQALKEKRNPIITH